MEGSEDKKKYHLVKWEELLVSKRGGGLNIIDLSVQNKSLMMKWLWKFASPEVFMEGSNNNKIWHGGQVDDRRGDQPL